MEELKDSLTEHIPVMRLEAFDLKNNMEKGYPVILYHKELVGQSTVTLSNSLIMKQ